ncbi:MAG: hypothetical protein R2991_01780 [Thermoanaerobaculia bacterium]
MARKRRKRWWTKILMFALLEVGALAGVPMRPEDVEDMTRRMQGTKVVKTERGEESGDDDPPEGEGGAP